MLIPFLISKIHSATVTAADVDDSGSIAIDTDILKAAGLREFQKVEIYNMANGQRFSTHVISGKSGSGDIIVNGAGARLVSVGDRVIIAAYGLVDERELNSLNSVILLMEKNNRIQKNVTHGI